MKSYAVTVTLNTHPSKPGGIFNESTVFKLLNSIGSIKEITFELNTCCQLHIHALIISKTNKLIKKIINKWKKLNNTFKYSVKVDVLHDEEDILFWHLYLRKSINYKGATRELYYRLVRYYQTDEPFDMLELADYDIEVKNDRFKYVDPSKVKFID